MAVVLPLGNLIVVRYMEIVSFTLMLFWNFSQTRSNWFEPFRRVVSLEKKLASLSEVYIWVPGHVYRWG